jgi:hypothetical protein
VSDASGVKLRWCLVGGELRDVADFADVPAALRPPAVCPACRNPVVMKLGATRARHCAHRPADDCVLRRGETALHFNVKMYLYRQLSKGDALTVIEKCAGVPGVRECSATGPRLWLEGWDEVVVEHGLESRRPDIVLLKGRRAVAAVEVFVTHRVDAAKAADLRAGGVPWIEVKATPALYEQNWTTGLPLDIFRSEPGGGWTCDACAAEVSVIEAEAAREAAAGRWDAGREESLQSRRAFLAQRHARIREVKIVDCCYPDGRVEREEFTIVEWKEGGRARLRLEVDNPKTTVLKTRASSSGAMADLKSVCDLYLRVKSGRASRLVVISEWDSFEAAKGRERAARGRGGVLLPKHFV